MFLVIFRPVRRLMMSSVSGGVRFIRTYSAARFEHAQTWERTGTGKPVHLTKISSPKVCILFGARTFNIL